MPITPQDFVTKWRHATLNERSSSQSHFIDICQLAAHPAPLDIDPTGKFFRFEAGASKTSGGEGFADVWFKEHFAWEYKGKHADLDKAYQQLLQYREALENPPLLIVSDIDTIVIHTNFTNTVKRTYTLTLDALLTPNGLSTLHNVFHNPDALRAPQTTDVVTAQAATHFARLADKLRLMGNEPTASAHFLIQLLFCLFAEDVDLLPGKLFTTLVRTFRNRPQSFNSSLAQLFDAMASGGTFGVEDIPYFDGHLFDSARPIPLDADCLDILVDVSSMDWSSIEPSIFGTLFERSLDPSKRSQLGAHYTSSTDILLIIEPVLMAPLRREWQTVQAEARSLTEERSLTQEKSYNASQRAQRTKISNQISALLNKFFDKLATVQVLDPACGSGNFLYLALRSLLDLQKDVNTFAYALGISAQYPSVTPAQLHGIEINEYAHQLAQSTIQIGYIQWLRENGYGHPAEPILKPLDNIRHMDAILAYDDQGKPVEPDWPAADVIIGNPPFLGGNKKRSALGDKVEAIFSLYQDRVPATADLVCYWFEKARRMVEDGSAKRAGLLATNSIRHSSNRVVMDRILETGGIFWAQSDIRWVLDGADVRISMVAFDNGATTAKYLDGIPVTKINSDLTSRVDISCAYVLDENKGLSFIGIEKAGSFDIDEETASFLLSQGPNPNQRPNSDVVKPCINAYDLAETNRQAWIIDFVQMSNQEAAQYEAPFEYVQRHVKPERNINRRAARKDKWWIFGEPRPAMRAAIQNLERFIVTPRVSKHRFFSWLDKEIIPQNKLVVIARDDDYFFGVLHSRLHEVWSLAKAGRHGVGNDPAYSNDQCFETFPFPYPPGKERADDPNVSNIANAAQKLASERNDVLSLSIGPNKRTLTELYNSYPTWLQNAHRKLDAAVFAAYGWPPDLTDEQILAHLLELNQQRARSSS